MYHRGFILDAPEPLIRIRIFSKEAVAGGSDVAAKILKAVLVTRASGKRITTPANKGAEKRFSFNI